MLACESTRKRLRQRIENDMYMSVTFTSCMHNITGIIIPAIQRYISYTLDMTILTCFGDNCSNTVAMMVHNSIEITVSSVDVLCSNALTFTVYKKL